MSTKKKKRQDSNSPCGRGNQMGTRTRHGRKTHTETTETRYQAEYQLEQTGIEPRRHLPRSLVFRDPACSCPSVWTALNGSLEPSTPLRPIALALRCLTLAASQLKRLAIYTRERSLLPPRPSANAKISVPKLAVLGVA